MVSLILLAAAFAEPRPSMVMYGNEGGVSCSNGWKPEFRQATESYIRGLWSGMTLANSARTSRHAMGRNISPDDVKKSCAKNPDGLIRDVAERVYISAHQRRQ